MRRAACRVDPGRAAEATTRAGEGATTGATSGFASTGRASTASGVSRRTLFAAVDGASPRAATRFVGASSETGAAALRAATRSATPPGRADATSIPETTAVRAATPRATGAATPRATGAATPRAEGAASTAGASSSATGAATYDTGEGAITFEDREATSARRTARAAAGSAADFLLVRAAAPWRSDAPAASGSAETSAERAVSISPGEATAAERRAVIGARASLRFAATCSTEDTESDATSGTALRTAMRSATPAAAPT